MLKFRFVYLLVTLLIFCGCQSIQGPQPIAATATGSSHHISESGTPSPSEPQLEAAPKQAVTTRSETSPSAPQKICPKGKVSNGGDSPHLVVRTAVGKEIWVCGESATSQFDVMVLNSKGEFQKNLMSMPLNTQSRVYEENGVLAVEEAFYMNEKWVPVFKHMVNCSPQCQVRWDTCQFSGNSGELEGKIQNLPDLNSLKTKKSVTRNELSQVFELGLLGHKPAMNFYNKPMPRFWDGTTKEIFSDYKDILYRFKNAKCADSSKPN